MENQNISILVADDNIINQKVAEFTLRNMNLPCDFANNGEEAYLMHKENKYNIILMDMQMPILDGIDATQKIRELEAKDTTYKRVSIFAVTANSMGDEAEKYSEMGLDGYISKPLNEKALVSVINDLRE